MKWARNTLGGTLNLRWETRLHVASPAKAVLLVYVYSSTSSNAEIAGYLSNCYSPSPCSLNEALCKPIAPLPLVHAAAQVLATAEFVVSSEDGYLIFHLRVPRIFVLRALTTFSIDFCFVFEVSTTLSCSISILASSVRTLHDTAVVTALERSCKPVFRTSFAFANSRGTTFETFESAPTQQAHGPKSDPALVCCRCFLPALSHGLPIPLSCWRVPLPSCA